MADSVAREDVITSLQQGWPSSLDAYQLMNGITRGVFATKYGAWDGTIHTAGYSPQTLSATITFGGDAAPIPLPFAKWLAGEPLYLSKLKGSLNAKVGFANEIIKPS